MSHLTPSPHQPHISNNRKEDVESKYYADGEDAFAMKRDLTGLAEQLERETKARKQKLASVVAANTPSH